MNRLNQYTTAAYAPAQGAAQPNAVCLKPVPVQRQEIDLGITARDLNFFKAEFERFKWTTGIGCQTILDELWYCQS